MPVLSGVRVLDMGWVWAGPLVGNALAALGAEVVKIESEGRFDPLRLAAVEGRDDLGDLKRESSLPFHRLNYCKKSLSLDLRRDEGRSLFLRLVSRADLLLENYQAGTLDRLGLSWDALRAANPRLVVLSMSAGGQTGRWRNLKAYDLITAALAGYESLIGYAGEPPLGGPTLAAADPGVGAFGVFAALVGLTQARRTGRGAYFDVSGVEALMALMGYAFLEADGPDGSEAMLPAVELTLRCRGEDRWVALVLTADRELDLLMDLVGGTAPASWEELRRSPEARAHLAVLAGPWAAGLTREVACAILEEAGIASAPVLSVEERNELPSIKSLYQGVIHPVTSVEEVFPPPWGCWVVPTPAPLLGQHTDAVLHDWLALERGEIARLRAQGVLAP